MFLARPVDNRCPLDTCSSRSRFAQPSVSTQASSSPSAHAATHPLVQHGSASSRATAAAAASSSIQQAGPPPSRRRLQLEGRGCTSTRLARARCRTLLTEYPPIETSGPTARVAGTHCPADLDQSTDVNATADCSPENPVATNQQQPPVTAEHADTLAPRWDQGDGCRHPDPELDPRHVCDLDLDPRPACDGSSGADCPSDGFMHHPCILGPFPLAAGPVVAALTVVGRRLHAPPPPLPPSQPPPPFGMACLRTPAGGVGRVAGGALS